MILFEDFINPEKLLFQNLPNFFIKFLSKGGFLLNSSFVVLENYIEKHRLWEKIIFNFALVLPEFKNIDFLLL